MKDIIYGILALILVGILLTFTHDAFAGRWFPEASVYLDVTTDSSEIYCGDRGDFASHMGARLDLYSEGPHTIRAMWVHNSCIEAQSDLRNRDTLGIGYEYKLW